MRERLALFPDAATRDRLRAEQAQDRLRLLAALERENLRPDLLENADSAQPSRALTDAVQRYTARANSNVMMVQIEDILRQLEQINVPGTVDEQPNWRRRLSLALEAWSDHAPLRELCAALNRERISRTDT